MPVKEEDSSVGLVLSGGGAKGAYQVGALTYLSEIGFQPHLIAGTSIGALNGAVLASHKPFPVAVRLLNELWERLGTEEIIQPNPGALIRAAGHVAGTLLPSFGSLYKWLVDFLAEQGLLKSGMFDPAPIERLIRETVNVEGMRTGLELWVAVFPSLSVPGLGSAELLDFVRAGAGVEALWLRGQDFTDSPDTLYRLLLASAAIPLAFPKQEVNGRFYVDGGLADNVPLGALAKVGCTHAIVIHLSNGAAWSRHEFPMQIIEVLPREQILKTETPAIGTLTSLLDFNPERIRELKRRGYEDAERSLASVVHTLTTVSNQRRARDLLVDSTMQILNDSPL